MKRDRICDSCNQLFTTNKNEGGMVNGVLFILDPPALDRPQVTPTRVEIRIGVGLDLCGECVAHYLRRVSEQAFPEYWSPSYEASE